MQSLFADAFCYRATMVTQQRGSMLAYLGQAVSIWRLHPIALTAPLTATSWLFIVTDFLVPHLRPDVRSITDLLIFPACISISYLAHMLLSQMVSDILVGQTLHSRRAASLWLHPSTLRTIGGLLWRVLLWFGLSLCLALIFEGAGKAFAALAHHALGHSVLRRPFRWVLVLTWAACLVRYSFAIPYLVFSQGRISAPISLSLERTKQIRGPLTLLTLCGAAAMLTIIEVFRLLLPLYLHSTGGTKFAFDIVGAALQNVPNAVLIIALTAIAHQDWLALDLGLAFQVSDHRDI